MYSADLIQKTRDTLEPKYDRPLTQAEVEEILDNLKGFAEILIDYYYAEKKAKRQSDKSNS